MKVIAGRHEGETGLVVRIEANLAVLLSDLTLQEVCKEDHVCVVIKGACVCCAQVYVLSLTTITRPFRDDLSRNE